jgi:ribosomal protein S18 acetylase RimI-like enzyme
MPRYTDSLVGVTPAMLAGFFEGWPSPPSPEAHLRILRGSAHVGLAIDDGRVVGFIAAVGDGVMCAYITLLEVLPAYRGRGIGSALARRLVGRLEHLYMIDVVCDAGVVPFYERLGMKAATGATLRRYERQPCEQPPRG